MGVKLRGLLMLPCFLAALIHAQNEMDQKSVDCYSSIDGTIYDYGATTLDGTQFIPFKAYQGKYILFVNVATY
nr:glutathione peroxidase 3 (plasma) [Xenopus tropicalis]